MTRQESIITLRRLIDAAPLNSLEQYRYQAELLGYECAEQGPYVALIFWMPEMQSSYERGYREAQVKAHLGECTLGPLDVAMLVEPVGAAERARGIMAKKKTEITEIIAAPDSVLHALQNSPMKAAPCNGYGTALTRADDVQVKKGGTQITIPKQMLEPDYWCWDDGTPLG